MFVYIHTRINVYIYIYIYIDIYIYILYIYIHAERDTESERERAVFLSEAWNLNAEKLVSDRGGTDLVVCQGCYPMCCVPTMLLLDTCSGADDIVTHCTTFAGLPG